QGRIGRSADCALALTHVTATADVVVEFLAAHLDEAITRTEGTLPFLRRRSCRDQRKRCSQADHPPMRASSVHHVFITRSCSRLIASSEDRIAPSCQAGNAEACSPARTMRLSIWQRLP